MSKIHELDSDDKRIIVIERDANLPWAVATIILFLAIGFGVIVSMHHSTLNSLTVSQAAEEMRRYNSQKLAQNSAGAEERPSKIKIELPEIKSKSSSGAKELEKSESSKVELEPGIDSGNDKSPVIEEFQE